MNYEFVMQRLDGGGAYSMFYDSAEHILRAPDGERITTDPEQFRLPGPDGGEEGMTVRFVMGKRCNFKCAYCTQDGIKNIREEAAPSDRLIPAILRFLGDRPVNQAQFWGGETLLYFEQIRELHALFERSGKAPKYGYSVFTNGKLLGQEKILAWLLENDIGVGLSWDGKGQHVRGENPFDDPAVLDAVRKLAQRPGKFCFNPVITAAWDGNLADYFAQIRELAQTEDVVISEGRIAAVHHAQAWESRFPEEKMAAWAQQTFLDLITGKIGAWNESELFAASFLGSLGRFDHNQTQCFVSSPRIMAVDLQGNLLTCQNFHAGQAANNLGSVFDLEPGQALPLPDLAHLMERQRRHNCRDCVVYAVCRCGCPYGNEDYHAYNCKAQFYMFLPTLGRALHVLTGDLLTNVRPCPGVPGTAGRAAA